MYEINRFRQLLLLVAMCVLVGIGSALITQQLRIDPRSIGAQAFGLSLIMGIVLPLNMFIQRRVRRGGMRWLRKA